MTKRKFNLGFKRQVVEELLGGVSTLTQLSRRHELAVSLIQSWKKKYTEGVLSDSESSKPDAVLVARIAELERMVGRLTMENDLLKKARASIEEQRRRNSSPITAKNLEAFKRGAGS